MSDEDEGFHVGNAKCIGVTAAAIKCVMLEETNFMKFGKIFWVPQSVVHDASEVFEKGHEGDLVVAEWFAKKEGWLDS